MASPKLLQPDEYVSALVSSINRATRRINILSLIISEDDSTRPIIDALCAASRRGITVDIGMDLYFTFKEIGETVSRWSYLRSQVQQMRATKKRLEQAGASVRWLGLFGTTLFSRRTHLKWSIIDDTVYTFGGVNLYATGIANNDYMFRKKDRALAERLCAEHDLVINTDKAARSYPSHSFESSCGTVLIDGGYMFDSVIYDRAIALSQDAERIIYVSQYCPTGRLGRLLKKKQAELYFNNWRSTKDKLNAALIRLSARLHGVSSIYTDERYLHAKFILFYLPDGKVVALSGSHNFVGIGVTLGTREIALESQDPSVIKQLESFFASNIAAKSRSD